MQSEKTKRHKDWVKTPENMTHAEKVAEVCGCSVRYVLKVLGGNHNSKTKLAENIQVADMMVRSGTTGLLESVKKAVNF